MGSNEESQEKTEDATPRKLRDARKRGQVSKSRDLNSVLLLLVAFGALAFFISSMGEQLRTFMVLCFESIPQVNGPRSDFSPLLSLLKEGFYLMSIMILPLVALVFVTAGLVSYLQTGAVFSTEPIKPSFDKINPVKGFKNIFKLKSLVELIKSTLKIIIVFAIAYLAIRKYFPDLLVSVTAALEPTLQLAGRVLTNFIVKIAVFFLFIALFDLMYQRWQYLKDLRMTKYGLMQEYKRDEGDPLLKSHRRQMHQEFTKGDVALAARSAAVIVNPIHIAVAVEYDRNTMLAPQITVKGQELVAEQIKNIARQYKVPIIENVPLARALYELDVGEEIPENLYQMMADVLSFVYRLKTEREIVN